MEYDEVNRINAIYQRHAGAFTLQQQHDGDYEILEDGNLVMQNLTYTRALTYIGARMIGSSHQTARGFALGIYV